MLTEPNKVLNSADRCGTRASQCGTHPSQTTHMYASPGRTSHMSTSVDQHQPLSLRSCLKSFASRQQARFIMRAGVQVCCLRLRAFRGLHPPTPAAEGWGPRTPPQLTLPSRTTSTQPTRQVGPPPPRARTPRPDPQRIPATLAAPGRSSPQAHRMITLDRTYVQWLQTSAQGSNTCTSPIAFHTT